MFQIKHLLILREQIAPFQVDFTVKEMALDFSKMKNAGKDLFLNLILLTFEVFLFATLFVKLFLFFFSIPAVK